MNKVFSVKCLYSFLIGFLLLVILASVFQAQTAGRKALYLSYDAAQLTLQALAEILPSELKNKNSSEQASVWPGWTARRDAEIRSRLAQGDEDTLVNFLLFGTSFTKQLRINAQQLEAIRGNLSSSPTPAATHASAGSLGILQSRINDFTRALSAPGTNERLMFAQTVFVNKKYDPRSAAGQKGIKDFMRAALIRVLSEQAGYARVLETARSLNNPSEVFAERSKLYRTRGLSSDTSLSPNFAIEEALKALQERNILSPRSVSRVAVIGPGLDFTDKQEGYDFYPQQTIQPFAVIDSLRRLNLAQSDRLQVTTFDLSPRVNAHIQRARQRAQRGESYVVQLPRNPQVAWTPGLTRYWERFGDQTGTPVTPGAIPAGAGRLLTRAVRVSPSVVAQVTPVDTNIVLQHLELPPAERFDLIVATNIFIYYDTFEQSLALINVERMLRPGGVLLSNNALLELPTTRVRSVGYSTAVYSDRAEDGDFIVWYQRMKD